MYDIIAIIIFAFIIHKSYNNNNGNRKASNYANMKKLEYKTTKESYRLIDKYKGSRFGHRYEQEYNKAASNPYHLVDFNKVQPGSGDYTGAIQQRAQLLREAKARSGGADAQAFKRVHRNANKVADLRASNLRYSDDLGGWVQWCTLDYCKWDTKRNNHIYVEQTWRQAHK